MQNRSRFRFALLCACLAASVAVGLLGRGYWTPDEPREADIAWRMSWQAGKAVPLLAGEAFCEKPPLAYWVAGAAIDRWGAAAWVARLPNLLYALVTALAVGAIGRRAAGPIAGMAAAAAITTFLLSYQVAIWLATDAPLVAAVAVALWGLYTGFYAGRRRERLYGYTCMHAALALGFLCKSAAGWMVPVLTLATLVIWEKRWRELRRWELYAGFAGQAALILTWVAFVYAGPDGPAHLKVFFWNNLAGRFAHVDAPEELQYAAAHRNTPGKYLIELPLYLWPWTLLVLAAIRAAWRSRGRPHLMRFPSLGPVRAGRPEPAIPDEWRLARFAMATFLPTLAVLSVAATARNIYLAPALPGLALLLGWWTRRLDRCDLWDARAIRATAGLLMLAVAVLTAALLVLGRDAWDTLNTRTAFVAISAVGLALGAGFLASAWCAVRQGRALPALFALLLAYCALLVGPASQIYRRVDPWQDLAVIGRAIGRDSAGRPLILFSSDETTRAFIDMYARTSVEFMAGPINATSTQHLKERLTQAPGSLVMTQLPGRKDSRTVRELASLLGLTHSAGLPADESDAMPAWASDSGLRARRRYALPNGRHYALLETGGADTPR